MVDRIETDVSPFKPGGLFVNSDGTLTGDGYRFLDQLWKRTGGFQDAGWDASAIAESLQTQIGELRTSLDALLAERSFSDESRVLDLLQRIEALEAGLNDVGEVSESALRQSLNIGDSNLLSGFQFVFTEGQVPTTRKPRVVLDTSNNVAYYDDGANLNRMSPQAVENTGTSTGFNETTGAQYVVIAVVQLDDVDGNSLVGINGSTLGFASPDAATVDTLECQWAVILSDSQTAVDSNINPAINDVLYEGASGGITFINDGGDILVSTTDFDDTVSPKFIPETYSGGTVYAHLALKITAGTGSVILSGSKLRAPRIS